MQIRNQTLEALASARATVSALELRKASLDASMSMIAARARDGSATDEEISGSAVIASNARAVAQELTSARATLEAAELQPIVDAVQLGREQRLLRGQHVGIVRGRTVFEQFLGEIDRLFQRLDLAGTGPLFIERCLVHKETI